MWHEQFKFIKYITLSIVALRPGIGHQLTCIPKDSHMIFFISQNGVANFLEMQQLAKEEIFVTLTYVCPECVFH